MEPGDNQDRTAVLAPAMRTWLRYIVPLTVLSAIALLPIALIALRARVPADWAGEEATEALGWKLIAAAWLCQLLLVAGAAAIVRERPSQLRALHRGVAALLAAIVPCAAAAAAIAIGALALVAPGLVLLVLLALTGASAERGARSRMAASVEMARRDATRVALALAGMLALDAAIGAIAHALLMVEVARHPAPAQLVAAQQFVRAVALALVLASPLPATVLAMIAIARRPPGSVAPAAS